MSVVANVLVVINPLNDPPVANAGADQSVIISDIVSLNGQGSTDPDGDALTYQWSIISQPQGSNASFIMPGLVENQFTADAAGVFEVQLMVSDGGLAATDKVVVTVIGAPTVSLTADPPVISLGETVTLSWEAVNADAVTIVPYIGAVAIVGSVTISPTSASSYTLTATGPGGTRSTSALVTIDTPFVLQIDAPLDQQTITRPDVLVRGIIRNSTGRETGITADGMVALQYEDQFMVNHVPLEQGENVITVTATDTTGDSHSVEVTVYADITGQYCMATTVPEMGQAPYQSELHIDAPSGLTGRTVLDYGPGSVKFGIGPPETLPLAISQPGLYWLEVEAKSVDNQVFNDEVAVLVYENSQLDALLKAKWNAMKTCLAAGDVQAALNHFSSASRDEFETIFTSFGDQLPLMAQQMQAIEMVLADEGFAKYRIMKDEVIDGVTYSITYDIYFSVDENGIWKIDRF
jgi:hypothetical protein